MFAEAERDPPQRFTTTALPPFVMVAVLQLADWDRQLR